MATPKTRRVKQRAFAEFANAKGSTQTTFRTSESVLTEYQQEVAAGEQFRSRRPNLNFEEMGIENGSNLSSTSTDATVTVCGPKRVRLGSEEMSLTAATRQVLGLDYSIAPTFAWTHDGRLLRDIYNDTYADLG